MSEIKEYTQSEILKMVPGSWNEVTLDTYINRLLQVKMPGVDILDQLDASIDIASAFIGLDKDIISHFPLETIKKINQKLMFMDTKPQVLKKTKYKWMTKMDEPSYDTYILYIRVSEQISKNDFSNFPLVIKHMCKDKLTDEEVMALPMDEVETGFFLLRGSLKKYMQPTINILKTQVVMTSLRSNLQKLVQSKKKTKSIKSSGK